jgi:hypothetical protein
MCTVGWTKHKTKLGNPVYLPIYYSTVFLLDLSHFFSFLILYTVGRTPWTGDQPVAMQLPTHRTTQTQNKRTHRHPCLEWDWNPWSVRSSKRRQFMPETARPLGSALGNPKVIKKLIPNIVRQWTPSSVNPMHLTIYWSRILFNIIHPFHTLPSKSQNFDAIYKLFLSTTKRSAAIYAQDTLGTV